MLSKILLLAPLGLILLSMVRAYLSFRRHLADAKRSGIHYVCVPFFVYNRVWLIGHRAILPGIRKYLPEKYTQVLDYCVPDFSWDFRHEIFRRTGCDTFMTVAPSGLLLYTAEPAVISQITQRRNDFPKPTAIYKSVDIYGKNVVSSEGADWRHHRKSTSPPFTEKNNHVVWTETIDQSQAMLASWLGPDGNGDITVDRIMDDTMRLSLHVISRAGFGRKLEWPKTVGTSGHSKIENQKGDTDVGHEMSYTYALHTLLDTILLQFLLPRAWLRRLPLAIARKADTAYNEWGRYMSEMVSRKKKELSSQSEGAFHSVDIVGQLVRGQVQSQSMKGAPPPLTDSEILGNAFVLILAGHETAANSIHFSLIYLALHTATQRKLQADLDSVFHGRPTDEWDYDGDLPGLFNGMTAAVLNEELRLVPPVVNIPKSTFGVADQSLVVNGKKCTVPSNTYVALCTAAVQRNPAYWPHHPPSNPGGKPVHPTANHDNDLEEFRPERWLLDGKAPSAAHGGATMLQEKLAAEADIGVNESADTSEHLFRPVRGSYIPFSDGYRACLGRRFAQVEVLACLAVIFSQYSVELAVDKYASDHELDVMGEGEKRAVWEKAANDARDLLLNGCSVVITLQMRKGTVPLRFVRRGRERFDLNT